MDLSLTVLQLSSVTAGMRGERSNPLRYRHGYEIVKLINMLPSYTILLRPGHMRGYCYLGILSPPPIQILHPSMLKGLRTHTRTHAHAHTHTAFSTSSASFLNVFFLSFIKKSINNIFLSGISLENHTIILKNKNSIQFSGGR